MGILISPVRNGKLEKLMCPDFREVWNLHASLDLPSVEIIGEMIQFMGGYYLVGLGSSTSMTDFAQVASRAAAVLDSVRDFSEWVLPDPLCGKKLLSAFRAG